MQIANIQNNNIPKTNFKGVYLIQLPRKSFSDPKNYKACADLFIKSIKTRNKTVPILPNTPFLLLLLNNCFFVKHPKSLILDVIFFIYTLLGLFQRYLYFFNDFLIFFLKFK